MRRVLYAYVFTFTESSGQERALIFCSPACGNNALADPPTSWDAYREQLPRAYRHAVTCYGCGLTIAEANEAEAGCAR